jgi:glutathione S-transferase
VLPDGATVLTETTLILPYLDRISGARPPPLLPMDDDDLRILSGYGRVTGMLDGIAVWNRELRRPEDERSPGVIALEAARANRVADALEREAAEGAGPAAGPGIDAARIALACALGYCERRHTVWRWREGRPALSAWLDAFARRPSFRATVPPPSGI